MKKDPLVLLQHILESISWIEKYTTSLTADDFYKNVPAQDAVVRRIEIIGETVKNLPSDLKQNNPNTP